MKSQRPASMHQAFDDIELMTRQFALDDVRTNPLRSQPRSDTDACADDWMAASKAFFHKEQARHAAMALALQAQLDRGFVRCVPAGVWETLRQRRRAAPAPVVDVDARELRPDAVDDALGGS